MGKVRFTHLWFGLFILYLLVISNLTLYPFEILFFNIHYLDSIPLTLNNNNNNNNQKKKKKKSLLFLTLEEPHFSIFNSQIVSFLFVSRGIAERKF